MKLQLCPLYLWAFWLITQAVATVHKPGYCAMYGNCPDTRYTTLPCVSDEPAKQPTGAFQQQLINTCGAEFASSAACCNEEQLNDLIEQVKRAEPIMSSCPACWKNFLSFWCTFTCSPNQSTMVNITTSRDGLVTQADYWVGDGFGSQFYDSCKDIKFGASNGYAMDFIGGGAQNWHDMVTYMGMKRPSLGSPFQIDFPVGEPTDGMELNNAKGRDCNDPDLAYKCSCVDCEKLCPVLPPTPGEVPKCTIGLLSCWSFSMVLIYAFILILSLGALLRQNHKLQTLFESWGASLWNRGGSGGVYERLAMEDGNEDEENERLLDPDTELNRYWLNGKLQSWFYYQGLVCARNPYTVIILSLLAVTLCSLGWQKFALERDPVHLWVAPSSTALAQKTHFDTNFSPFYRTTQIFLVSESDEILTSARLESLFALEDSIKEAQTETGHYTFQDVCFRPTGDVCILQSVTGYWGGDVNAFDPENFEEDLELCTSQPSLCLPEFQLPLKPQMVLGGYEGQEYLKAKAMIVTFVLQNSLDPVETAKSEEWERFILRTILSNVNAQPEWEGVNISYSTESSLETELNKSSNTDATTVLLSYLVMFLYASIALGRFTSLNPRRLVVDSKFSLAICGILIVLFSVSSAVGIFSLTGKKITLIIAEVIPFLVLAVGVDNIFILCHEYERRLQLKTEESIEERAAKTLGKMGPSILLSSLSETIAFGLGTLVTMPAVSSFAIVASLAVFVDFVLQVTCFVSCMVLDARRTESKRIDCIPCISVNAPETLEKEGWLEWFTNNYYVPVILHPKARYPICLSFLGLFMFCLALVPQLPLGLDQRIALPSDSYLVNYFDDLSNYFNVGPPVYFVVQGNLTDKVVQKKVCGRFSTCNEHSIANVLEQERKRPETSFIGEPTSVWIDDFLYWLSPNLGCCRFKKTSIQKQSPVKLSLMSSFEKPQREMCGEWDDEDSCEDCKADWKANMDTLPEGEQFMELYDLWISRVPDESCPLAGKAAYGDAIVASPDKVSIETSHFRTFHTPLRTQEDFIEAYGSARRIAKDLQDELGLEVYPYSVFYIFFEQYTYIVTMAVQLLTLAILSIFVVTSTLLGSIRSGLLVMLVVIMILVDVIGVMTIWGISLNAVSLVNLVICVGISVEFCCHIARGFMVSRGTLEERAGKSMVDVGSSVFCGITLTKFAGIVVLAFTRSKIFEVYYFRMYLLIVIFGALHGLVLLPVLLSVAGGEGMGMASDFDEDGFEWSAGSPSWPRLGGNHQNLLADDNASLDQVLITDMPEVGRLDSTRSVLADAS
ncbi:patched family-domain-containing protein [Phycomyces nitens]|nr:patched family-domain-containing protein [Phycomyces nitens]